MEQLRLATIAILLTLLAYALGFMIIAVRRKFREIDDEFGPLQCVE